MESVWLDTAALAIPNYAVSQAAAEELFLRAVVFEEMVMPGSPLRVVISDNAENDLWAAGYGPGFNEIDDFLELMNLKQFFNAQDILQSYNTVLQRAVRATAATGFEITVADQFSTTPAMPVISPVDIRGFTELALTNAAAHSGVSDTWSVGTALPGVAKYSVTARALEALGPGAASLGGLPKAVASDVKLFQSFKDFVCEAEALRLWTTATGPEGVSLALTVKALLLRGALTGAPAKVADLEKFKIGTEFIPSLEVNQAFGTAPFSVQTFERCAHVIAKTGVVSVGKFGKHAATIRGVDGAVGQRFHVSSGGVGLRGMFWRTATHIELANVGPKFELVIEHGVPERTSNVNCGRCDG